MKIKNYETISKTEDRELILKLINKGIQSVLPENVIQNNVILDNNVLKIKNQNFLLDNYKRIIVIGGGKASYKMAEKINDVLKDKISFGYVNSTVDKKIENITINQSRHPIPDAKGVEGVKEMFSIETREDDLILCLISGGGSAMLPLPQESISLEDLKIMNNLFLKAGANIYELNSVRKHVSQIKGGQLAAKLYPATVVSLILSDVLGDDLSVIASGPTSPDSSTFQDAMKVIEKYNLTENLPKKIMEHLNLGMEGKIDETIKEGDKIFEKVHNFILANNYTALKAMKEEAEKKELKADIVNSDIQGEAREAGSLIAEELVKAENNSILIFGGEPVVTVKGKGIGGRSQELILATIEKIKDQNITIASAGTDGIDFYEVAGAIADGQSYEKVKELNLDIAAHFKDNSSFDFFQKMEDYIITGPTGTNVADIIVGVKR